MKKGKLLIGLVVVVAIAVMGLAALPSLGQHWFTSGPVAAYASEATTTNSESAAADAESGETGGHEEGVDVGAEFQLAPLAPWLEFRAGPFDFSVTKAVIYLWLALAVIIVGTIILNANLKNPMSRRFAFFEGLYDLARQGIVNSVMRKGQGVWFPYIGSIFFFIFVSNLIGLIPLPFGHRDGLAFYGATANLNATVMLALCTFVLTHYAGIRAKGAGGYFKGMIIPSAPPVLRQMLFVLHLISELFRLLSLAVRLFANIVAGHAIFAVFYAMAVVFSFWATSIALQGASIVLYLFEVFVAFIQAFIFAILSAIYIGGALEEEH
ncbi:MAG: F0F1 ATP synthase subunit A [Thermoleophilia bacterium]